MIQTQEKHTRATGAFLVPSMMRLVQSMLEMTAKKRKHQNWRETTEKYASSKTMADIYKNVKY